VQAKAAEQDATVPSGADEGHGPRRSLVISTTAPAFKRASARAFDEPSLRLVRRWPHADRDVAYKRLDGPVKDQVDVLLRLNKDYAKWIAGAPDERTAKLHDFVNAATCADDIKTKEYG
jgi:hypothetical protein